MHGIKKLSVISQPGFDTECYHNVRLSIVMAHPGLIPWVYSHFVNLVLNMSEVETFPRVRFEEHLEVYSSIFDEKPLASGRSWTRAIREQIDEGNYVIAYFNWRHIPSSVYYRQPRDMVHEALIYGYDDGEQRFLMLAFDVDGNTYGESSLSYTDCELELKRVVEESLGANKWFAFYGFPASVIRVSRTSVPLEQRMIYFALDRGRVSTATSGGKTFALGYGVTGYMAWYFNKAAEVELESVNREFALWDITIYKMMLHKKVMGERLQYLRGITDCRQLERIASFYQKCSRTLLQIKGTAYKYRRTQNSEHLGKLGELFAKMYEYEKRAVPMFMEALVDGRMDAYQNHKEW